MNWKMQHRKNTGLGNFLKKTGTTEARSTFKSQSKIVRKILSQKKSILSKQITFGIQQQQLSIFPFVYWPNMCYQKQRPGRKKHKCCWN